MGLLEEVNLLQTEPPGTARQDACGSFRVLHQIGAGALGPVFRAYEPVEGKLAAVKLFRRDSPPDQAIGWSLRSTAAGRPTSRIRPSRAPRHGARRDKWYLPRLCVRRLARHRHSAITRRRPAARRLRCRNIGGAWISPPWVKCARRPSSAGRPRSLDEAG